jgi:hypothetical protein
VRFNYLDKQDKNNIIDIHENLMKYADIFEFFRKMEKEYSSGWFMYCRGHNKNNRPIFQVLSEEFVNDIASIVNRKLSETGGNLVLEVMAGDGKLSEFLRPKINGTLITTDSMIWESIIRPDFVEPLGAKKAIEKYNPDIIIMCWEPYGSRIGVELAKKGHSLIWIGEGSGGCCGGFDYEYEDDPAGIYYGSKFALARTDYVWSGEYDFGRHTDIILFNFGEKYRNEY